MLQAIWENQFYYLFGFLFLVFIILIISCSQIAIVMVYFQLCGEVSYHLLLADRHRHGLLPTMWGGKLSSPARRLPSSWSTSNYVGRLVIICSQIAIIMVYFQLCGEVSYHLLLADRHRHGLLPTMWGGKLSSARRLPSSWSTSNCVGR